MLSLVTLMRSGKQIAVNLRNVLFLNKIRG